jgi:hypothetical protein
METSLRPVAILLELILLVGVIYSLFTGMNLALSDLGLDRKYAKFLKTAVILLTFLILFFLVSHLITFYPRISVLSTFQG